MTERRPPGRVEDYTGACLVVGLVNLLWVLGVIWALLGLPAVIVTGLVLDRVIARLGDRG